MLCGLCRTQSVELRSENKIDKFGIDVYGVVNNGTYCNSEGIVYIVINFRDHTRVANARYAYPKIKDAQFLETSLMDSKPGIIHIQSSLGVDGRRDV